MCNYIFIMLWLSCNNKISNLKTLHNMRGSQLIQSWHSGFKILGGTSIVKCKWQVMYSRGIVVIYDGIIVMLYYCLGQGKVIF